MCWVLLEVHLFPLWDAEEEKKKVKAKQAKKKQNQKPQKTLLPQELSNSPATWQGRHLFISWLQQCSPSIFVHY